MQYEMATKIQLLRALRNRGRAKNVQYERLQRSNCLRTLRNIETREKRTNKMPTMIQLSATTNQISDTRKRTKQ